MDFSQNELDELFNVFSVEADEIIARLNANLFKLEKSEDKNEVLMGLFRDAHSLKGASRMVGFNHVQEIAHKLEDVLGLAKEDKLDLSEDVANKLYRVVDFLSELIQCSVSQKCEVFTDGVKAQLGELDEILKLPKANEEPKEEEKPSLSLVTNLMETLNLDFVQKEITEKFESFSYLDEITEFVNSFNDEEVDKTTSRILRRLLKVAKFAKDNFIQLDKETISTLQQCMASLGENAQDEFVDKEMILQRLEIIQQLLEINFAPPKKEMKSVFDTGQLKTLRIETKKIDEFANSISELMMSKQRTLKHQEQLFEVGAKLLELQKGNFEDVGMEFLRFKNEIRQDMLRNDLLLKNIEEMVKNIRVLPLATIFHLFGRMVRDIAQEKGKQIDLEIVGSETSVDKSIIEDIKTPLIHIIRNAIDHGIETPERRLELGKNPVGKIVLKAKHLDNKILIEIIDDGSGLNIEKIKERALSKGYLSQAELDAMNDEEITNIIFWAGFSTGNEITNISGRGIGLDIVQSKIAQLKGNIKVDFEINRGCQVRIALPVMMATIKTVVVKAGGQFFALPMPSIKEIKWGVADKLIVDNEFVEVYNLSEILGLKKMPSKGMAKLPVVAVLEASDKVIGLTFDELVDEAEVLQRKLKPPLDRIKNFSGVTTLNSGDVCFILDVNRLLQGRKPTLNLPIKQNSDYTILVVDDSLTARVMMQTALQGSGYYVLLANDPIEGFEIMRQGHVDLIISDLEMPKMDGIEFLDKLKVDELYHNIPFIMLTSVDSERERALQMGAVEYFLKSELNQEGLLELIAKTLG